MWSLGGNVGFWADDDYSYYAFPHSINGSNLAQVSGIGDDDDDTAHKGIVRWGEGTKWGFSWDQGSDDNMINLQYGNGDYGATFGLAMAATDNGGSGDANVSTSSMGLSGSYGRVMDFGELGVGFMNNSSDDGDSDATDYDDASMGFWVNLRRAQSLWIFDNMLVNFTYSTNNHTNSSDEAGEHAETNMDLDLNYYTHLSIGANTTALVAMGFGYSSGSALLNVENATSTTISLPNWTVGIETSMTDWATVRVGLTSGYNLSKTSNNGLCGTSACTDVNDEANPDQTSRGIKYILSVHK